VNNRDTSKVLGDRAGDYGAVADVIGSFDAEQAGWFVNDTVGQLDESGIGSVV
jgi:hypothetical protein